MSPCWCTEAWYLARQVLAVERPRLVVGDDVETLFNEKGCLDFSCDRSATALQNDYSVVLSNESGRKGIFGKYKYRCWLEVDEAWPGWGGT